MLAGHEGLYILRRTSVFGMTLWWCVAQVRVEIGAMDGTHVFYIAMEDVFMWSRKARQFLNKCRDFMATGLARPEG